MKNLILFARKEVVNQWLISWLLKSWMPSMKQGGAYKRKEDMHRMAEANRAFAHFRF